MPYGIFKEVKIKCNVCNTIVTSTSATKWDECPCGQSAVMGLHSFIRQRGNCTDLSVMDYGSIPDSFNKN